MLSQCNYLNIIRSPLPALHPTSFALYLNFARTPPLSPRFNPKVLAGKHGEKAAFLGGKTMFFSSIPEPFANLKHIFRMLKIYVENTHNHLITPEKHSLMASGTPSIRAPRPPPRPPRWSDKKIERCILIQPLSMGSEFHGHVEAIGMMV